MSLWLSDLTSSLPASLPSVDISCCQSPCQEGRIALPLESNQEPLDRSWGCACCSQCRHDRDHYRWLQWLRHHPFHGKPYRDHRCREHDKHDRRCRGTAPVAAEAPCEDYPRQRKEVPDAASRRTGRAGWSHLSGRPIGWIHATAVGKPASDGGSASAI